MKFESDTEIDGLLRRQARRKTTSASSTYEKAFGANGDDEGQAALSAGGAAHLDADEMNAFAEGTLPDAARARYFSHLADCDECRNLVTKLSLAANVSVEQGKRPASVEAGNRSSWRDWLAALFAPQALRYAVPALALLAVIVIAFIATRERRQAGFVAQNEERQQNTAAAPLNQASQDESQGNTTTATSNTTVATATEAPQQNANTSAKADSQTEAVKNTAPLTAQRKDADSASDVTVMNDALKPSEKAPTGGTFATQARDNNEVARVTQDAPPPVAVSPAASKAPAANSSVGEEAETKTVDGSKKNNTSASAVGRSSGIVLDGATSDSAQDQRKREQEGGRREGPAARRSRPADTQLSRETDGDDAKENRATETRRAGGRQFRRQGGVWIDTAYSSSRSTVNVARGSEQYRALVADEPGIRAIADQLGGTVIIVWKQRAYRIY